MEAFLLSSGKPPIRVRLTRHFPVTRLAGALRADVFDYIERYYNRQLRHSYVGNISPAEFEERTMRA